ncbi:hypothetical protein CH373_09345 [Leptospira perolatii]|uniref:STAS domain-containing protein n=1 Tax=Leptospira perolatii TaxID=2023191 RepID=A0A2M9ZMC7_9LEPT|nr:STAS domain-containing protein [Leptospira perolatii]PJZ68490.1 hypothetical protein CH360_15845 [Leptospira perolatii]PJZ73187.1 hypothetical protein CH373_09345 [Leptospira perolatii]
MELKTVRSEKILRIYPSGPIDSLSAPELLGFLQSRVSAGDHRFLFVCDSIPYIEEDGIYLLLELKRTLEKQGGCLAYCGWNEESHLILGLFGLDKQLPIFRTPEEAEVWLSAIHIEDNRTGLLVGLNQTLRQEKPLKFYSSGSSSEGRAGVAKSEWIPEVRTLPVGSEEFSSGKKLEGNLARMRKDFTQEKILYCGACSSRLRIRLVGRYKCPSCGIQFDVNRMGGVRYLEKLLQ